MMSLLCALCVCSWWLRQICARFLFDWCSICSWCNPPLLCSWWLRRICGRFVLDLLFVIDLCGSGSSLLAVDPPVEQQEEAMAVGGGGATAVTAGRSSGGARPRLDRPSVRPAGWLGLGWRTGVRGPLAAAPHQRIAARCYAARFGGHEKGRYFSGTLPVRRCGAKTAKTDLQVGDNGPSAGSLMKRNMGVVRPLSPACSSMHAVCLLQFRYTTSWPPHLVFSSKNNFFLNLLKSYFFSKNLMYALNN